MKRVSRDTVQALRVELRYCREEGLSFNACLAEARKQHAKEVREEALNAVTPSK